MIKGPTLIIFGGLPGTGKTSLARTLSSHLKAVYLRIDTIDTVLFSFDSIKIGDEGYRVAYAVAEDNLRAGNIVIADSVNPIPITRKAWRDVAVRNDIKVVEIEVICSDSKEHRQRVETRKADIIGHKLPTWQEVADREYHPWETRDFVIDTAHHTEGESFEILIKKLSALF